MILNDFLAKLPIDVIKKTKIYPNSITLPVDVDLNEFYISFKAQIKDNAFTAEKAIFVASKYRDSNKFKTSIDLLNSKLRFT